MSEEQIIAAIANSCQDSSLHFQIIIQDRTLHVYINRQSDRLNYQTITPQIYTAVTSLEWLKVDEIYLYSRILGEVESDWSTCLEVKEPGEAAIDNLADLAEEIVDEVEDTSSLVEELQNEPHIPPSLTAQIADEIETTGSLAAKLKDGVETQTVDTVSAELADVSTGELASEASQSSSSGINLSKSPSSSRVKTASDLSQYCFIRNRRLLSADLVAPKENIARLIETFDTWELSVKRSQLPILATYFKSEVNPNLDSLAPELQIWWQQILELDSEPRRKLAIWLSRYCQDSKQTLANIVSVFEPQAAVAAAQSETVEVETQTSLPVEYNRTTHSHPQSARSRSKHSSRTKPKQSINLLIPLGWLLVAVIIIAISFSSNQSASSSATVCQNTTGDPAYCQLATEILGEEELTESVQNTQEFEPESLEVGLEYCQIYGNTAAGIPLSQANPSQTPLLSVSTEKIFPGIYLSDLEQNNRRSGDPIVRTVCIFQQKTQYRNLANSVQILAIEQVDIAWPETAYEPTENRQSLLALNQALGTYGFLGKFGLHTFFTAIIIYLLIMAGMAIRANSLATIYQASFMLGIIEAGLASLPLLGWWVKIPLECIALGITSAFVPGFKVDWSAGYHFVAATAMLLIASRLLLYWLTLAFLFNIFV